MKITVASGHKLTIEAGEIAYALGREIVQRRHILITGGAAGGDEKTSRGAFDYLNSVGLDTKTYIKTILPVRMKPVFRYGEITHYGDTRYDRRFQLVKLADLVVLVAGRKGTEDIYYSAIVGSKMVLPVGKSGGVAQAKWEEFSRNLNRYYGEIILLDEFRNLNPANNQPEKVAKWTVNLAEQLYAQAADESVDTQMLPHQPTLRQLITKHFNETELRILCSDLGIDWENLSGANKPEKVIQILEYCTRHGMDKRLLTYIRENRLDLNDLLPES